MRKAATSLLSIGVLVGLTVGLQSGPASAAAAAPAKKGQCLNLTTKQLDGDAWPAGAKAVACTKPHTYEVADVTIIPTRIAKYGYGSMTVNAWRLDKCKRIFGAAYDSDGADLNWLANVLYPSARQWKAGARWMVCGGTQRKWRNKAYRFYAIAEPYSAARPTTRYYFKLANYTWKPVKPKSSGSLPAIALRSLEWKNQFTKKYPGSEAIFARAQLLLDRYYRNVPDRRYGVFATKSGWNKGSGRYFTVLGTPE